MHYCVCGDHFCARPRGAVVTKAQSPTSKKNPPTCCLQLSLSLLWTLSISDRWLFVSQITITNGLLCLLALVWISGSESYFQHLSNAKVFSKFGLIGYPKCKRGFPWLVYIREAKILEVKFWGEGL